MLWTPGAREEGRGGTQQEEKAAQAEVMCLAAVPPALDSGREESRGSGLGGKAAMPGGLCRGGQELQDAGAWRMQEPLTGFAPFFMQEFRARLLKTGLGFLLN